MALILPPSTSTTTTGLTDLEFSIRDIDWIPQKRSKGGSPGLPSYLLTIAGPKFPFFSDTLGPHRMAIVIDRFKETNEPLPTYTYTLPPSTITTHYGILHGIPVFQPPSLSPAERVMEMELERVDEARARLDNDADHYALKTITGHELATAFETVVDLMEVSVAAGPLPRRRISAGTKAENGNNGENEKAGDDQDLSPKERMLAGLVAAFSDESLGLDLNPAADQERGGNGGQSGEEK